MLNMYRRKLCFRFKFFTLLYTYLQTNDSFRDPLPSPPKNVYTALQDPGDILIHVSITIEITECRQELYTCIFDNGLYLQELPWLMTNLTNQRISI